MLHGLVDCLGKQPDHATANGMVKLSVMDNGGEFYEKIPINCLLYYKESLCGGSMTTYCLKVLLNTHGV